MTVLRDCFYWLTLSSNAPGQLVETVMIVFLTLEFRKTKSELQYAYYYILYISYLTDSFGNLSWWFSIWSRRPLKMLLTFMILYPFFVDGYAFIIDFHCQMYYMSTKCRGLYTLMMTTVQISTAMSAAISFILIAVAVKKSKRYSHNSVNARIEKRMILHAATSSIMLLIWVITIYLTTVFVSMPQFFDNLSFIIFFLQHYPPILLILWMNPTYRHLFYRFIKVDKYLDKENRVISIVGSPSTHRRAVAVSKSALVIL
uniref:Serpentine receptor class gamma n=1 Tax=Panagrellus redivivus TaxID=6233 RepID=A0A7E4VAU1_PANRE